LSVASTYSENLIVLIKLQTFSYFYSYYSLRIFEILMLLNNFCFWILSIWKRESLTKFFYKIYDFMHWISCLFIEYMKIYFACTWFSVMICLFFTSMSKSFPLILFYCLVVKALIFIFLLSILFKIIWKDVFKTMRSLCWANLSMFFTAVILLWRMSKLSVMTCFWIKKTTELRTSYSLFLIFLIILNPLSEYLTNFYSCFLWIKSFIS